MLNAHGADVVSAQLVEAEAGRWQGIKLSNYEKFGAPSKPSKFHQPEPVPNHPAHQVFKASDLGPEWERHIPSVTGGKGVLEEDAF